MRIGVPKEIKNQEYRVGLTPGSVRELVAAGHDVARGEVKATPPTEAWQEPPGRVLQPADRPPDERNVQLPEVAWNPVTDVGELVGKVETDVPMQRHSAFVRSSQPKAVRPQVTRRPDALERFPSHARDIKKVHAA